MGSKIELLKERLAFLDREERDIWAEWRKASHFGAAVGLINAEQRLRSITQKRIEMQKRIREMSGEPMRRERVSYCGAKR